MQTNQTGDFVDSLFAIGVQYQVPPYQRRYVWNEANWLTLWEDTLSLLGLEIDEKNGAIITKSHGQGEIIAASSLEDNKHFTGPFVTRAIGGNGTLKRFEVIDGQQRLTTFQIILCIIRDICVSKDYDLVNEAGAYIKNQDTVIRRNISESFPDPTYKFLPTEYDRPSFEKIATGNYGEVIRLAFDEKTKCLPPDRVEKARSEVFVSPKEISDNVLKAYEYFYEQIRVYVGEDYDYGKIDALLSSIQSKFELIQITLDSSDQSEKIFQSLNATGRKLSEFDYLRNNLFLRAGKLGTHAESGELYSKRFYDQYWHFENRFRYWDANRLESFFRVFLTAKLGPFCFQSDDNEDEKDKKAFEVYQKSYQKQVKNKGIKYEFQELSRYSEVYKEVYPASIDESAPDSIARRMLFYKDLKITSLFPFILHLKNEKGILDDSLHQVCDILESYIVRRMVNYGYGANDEDQDAYATIDEFFVRLIDGDEFSIENFVKSLRNWPSDRQILGGHQYNGRQVLGGLQRTANETYYGKHSSRKTAWSLLRYIFYRIEQHITSENTLSFGFFFDTPTRVMPESSRQDRNDWLSIGNLTFRVKKDRSQNQVNNYPFSETREVLLESPNIDLKLNKEICNNENWDLNQVRSRKEKLGSYFCEIWPGLKSWQAPKPKIVEWHFGMIKRWHPNFPYGHIIDEHGQEIHVDKAQLPPISIALLRGGEKVKFEKVQTQEGLRAINVNLISPENE